MIQIAPLPSMTCMEQYVKLLLSRFVKPHFSAGVIEVHVVFDAPGSQCESPKEIEQNRRDKCAKEEVGPHNCVEFSSDLLIPDKWRNVLSCRICKKSLTRYIAEFISASKRWHGLLSSLDNLRCYAFFHIHFSPTNSSLQM